MLLSINGLICLEENEKHEHASDAIIQLQSAAHANIGRANWLSDAPFPGSFEPGLQSEAQSLSVHRQLVSKT
jgi:hypothetical protein